MSTKYKTCKMFIYTSLCLNAFMYKAFRYNAMKKQPSCIFQCLVFLLSILAYKYMFLYVCVLFVVFIIIIFFMKRFFSFAALHLLLYFCEKSATEKQISIFLLKSVGTFSYIKEKLIFHSKYLKKICINMICC